VASSLALQPLSPLSPAGPPGRPVSTAAMWGGVRCRAGARRRSQHSDRIRVCVAWWAVFTMGLFMKLDGIPEPPEGYVPPLGSSRNTWTNIYKNKGRIDYCVQQFGVRTPACFICPRVSAPGGQSPGNLCWTHEQRRVGAGVWTGGYRRGGIEQAVAKGLDAQLEGWLGPKEKRHRKMDAAERRLGLVQASWRGIEGCWGWGWGLSLQRAMSVQHCGVWGGIASDRDALIMRGCCDENRCTGEVVLSGAVAARALAVLMCR